MKNITFLTALSAVFIFHSAFGQGALTPPGAPAPVMKTLDQIEARTPITNTSSLVTIWQPGSYYLTHNLIVSTGDGIDINTNNVTLDLNGFTIASTAASATGTGINFNNGWSDISIGNGHIHGGVTNNGSGVYGGGGLAYGINYSGNLPQNVLVSRVSVSGCLDYGIYLGTGNATVAEACTVRTVGSYGIFASTIKSCWAVDCGGDGIDGDQVSDSRGQSSGSGYALRAATAQNCYGQSTGSGSGITAGTAQNCFGSGSYTGIFATTAQNCFGSSTSGYGVYATTAENCYGSSNGTGVYATTAQNCYGYSSGSGDGLYAYKTASGCYGYSYSGTGLYAFIANSCSGSSLSVTHNLNSY